VVGLKPTFGRVSARGVFPLSWNLDHPGPIAKTVLDAAILLQVIAGYDELDPYTTHHPVDDYLTEIALGVKDLKIGLLDGDYSWDAEPDVLEIIREAGAVFSTLGAEVTPVELNFLREAALSNAAMLLTDGAAFHKDRLAENRMGFGEDTRTRLEMGRDLSSVEYSLARKVQTETKRNMELFFHAYDALILPTTPVPAPLIEGTNAIKQARSLTRFTAPFNLTGLPAISIPCGFNAEGLPIGLQIVTQSWAEKKLLRIAYAFEQATKWHEAKPVF
jgi:aspartyl-tRNA(Asn)/glutamyl-tRNA(Gln) amidotransferase subunit A